MIRKLSGFFALGLLFLVPLTTQAVELEWGAHLDARFGFEGETSFLNLAQIELAVSAEILPWLLIEASLASEDLDSVEFGEGFMTLGHETEDLSLALSAGRFDIPLGLSSSWYASPDNALPIAVTLNDALVEGWNNVGIMGEIGLGEFSLSIYLVDGEMDSITNSDSGRAAGARLTWAPLEGITVGLSAAGNRHALDQKSSWFGCDLQARFGFLALDFEYLARLPEDNWSRRSQGGLGQAIIKLEELIGTDLSLIIRGEILAPRDEENETSLSLGLSWAYQENLRLTLASKFSNEEDNTLVFQAITAF